MSISVEYEVRQAAEAIRAADALLITAGAGMGVDSGLPDFRGTQGFWRSYPVVGKLGLSIAIRQPTGRRRNPHTPPTPPDRPGIGVLSWPQVL